MHHAGVRYVVGPLAAAVLAACGPDQTLFVPSPPAVEGALSVVAFLYDSEGARAEAFDADQDALMVPAHHWGGRVPAQSALSLIYYAQSLSALDVPRGMVSAEPADPRSCLLKAPVVAYEAPLVDGVAQAWQRAAPPERYLTHVLGPGQRCESPDLCVDFREQRTTLPGSGNVEVLVRMDDESVLVGDIDGHFWRVWRDGRFEREPALEGAPARAAMVDRGGELWLGGTGGRVRRGRLGGAFEDLPMPDAATVASLGQDEATGEVLAVTVRTSTVDLEQVTLLRFEGWGALGSLEVPETELAHVRVRFVGGGAALATYGGPSLLHYNGRTVRNQIVGYANPLFELQVNDIAALPGFGVVFAANDGRLYRGGPPFDAWIAVESGIFGTEAEVVAPYAGGFVFGGPNGLVGQYYPEGRPCAAEALAGSDVEELVPMPGGELVIAGGSYTETGGNSVTWLFPRE